MHDSDFIPMREFCERFDIKVETMTVAKSEGRFPPEMFKKDRKSVLVDYKFVERRLAFRKKMWLEAHDLYFELMEVLPTQSALAKLLSKLEDPACDSSSVWNSWLSSSLFSLVENNKSFVLEARTKDYKFVRFSRWLLAIHKRIDLRTVPFV